MPAEEIMGLAADFGKASAGVTRAAAAAFKAEGDTFAKEWQANARTTAGSHAKHYPKTITSEMKLSTNIIIDTGPLAEGQGLLGRILEFGSATSGAHLDGARALPAAEKRLERSADAQIGPLLP